LDDPDVGNQFVLLTGSKNNAGDFLIKHRAKALFEAFRGDRALVDLDAWVPFDGARLKEVNRSKALILMGGPALQQAMRPNIYPMVGDLGEIRVPIIAMGIGWKSQSGHWGATRRYRLNEDTINLLESIEASGYLSSVRDYHTLNVLHSYGFEGYSMTGCPALYSLDHVGQAVVRPASVRKIGFSLGVSFAGHKEIRRQTQELITSLRSIFEEAELSVAFHHSVAPEYLRTHGSRRSLWRAHQEMLQWLESEDVSHVDIAGGASKLIEFYSEMDLHVGYRVHAHIFMNSISKPSVLINEDGRGIALKDVIGGLYLNAFAHGRIGLIERLLGRLGLKTGGLRAATGVPAEASSHLRYELEHGLPRLSAPRSQIDLHLPVMREFLRQLP
jgi:hypothetical protein